MVQLIKHDLEFILKQIEIAEAHAAGGNLATLVAGYNGNEGLTQAHLLPYGLRTVDGSYNNLLPGRENWGASDQSFPGLFDPTYMNDADGDRYDFNPLPNMETWYTNNNYANAGTGSGSQPGPGSGTVIDADPRIISNLIVDQTLDNPAAIAAALTHAGLSGQPLMTALGAIVAAKAALDTAIEAAEAAEGSIAGLEADVAAAQLALTAAEAAASAAADQAAADQVAFEEAQAQVSPAMDARDAALSAYTTLLTDAAPNSTQTVEIAAALADFEVAQTEYELVQASANGLEATANASATLSADAAAAVVAAQTALAAAEAALADAQTVDGDVAAANAVLDALLETHGVEMDGNTVYLPNVSPDEGLSSPFNGWMTIFGQFFDHGLDLVAKGGNGTVYVPLSPDDPLYVEGGQNYIPLTRVSVNPGVDGILGTADDGAGPKNLTTPWIDQNQTYASTASKQVFMREYIPGPDGKPIASGLLLEGSNGGLATWADIKAQARDVLGIDLTDLNVGNIPLVAADEYGNFIPGGNGYPQLVVGMGPDGQLGTADDVLREGNPAAPVSAQGVVLTGHAFLDDIAHAAVPVVVGGVLQADTDSALGYANADGTPGPQGQRGPTAYDNELLDRHFIAGDGRVNENIALTAVHQVFHAEHNRVVEMTKQIALDSGDPDFLNEWLLVDVAAMPTTQAEINALIWDGERLFQAGRFTNEMEYQHLVFQEFGRMMQPDIDAFLFEPSADINPNIAAEFAHVVYRFGHSMLRQDIAVIEMDENGNLVQNDISLFDGFLNPVMYDSLGDAEAASGAIIRGMSRQTGSAIDEFVTDVLRNQLLGIPLDLATINIARGRDVGTPPLNAAREKFFAETGDTLLKPYTSWADFALNMKNPASIINFIAAYGTHASVLNTQADPKSVEELRAAATKLVLGDSTLTGEAKTVFDNDRLDFLNATGAYAGGTLGGLNTVDFWMGGLAEKKMSFGGMLGSTFSFVFQMTMENLQDADRFYYLSRTQGLNLLNELENNTFAELVMRNTDLGDVDSTALPGNLFSAFQMPTLEMDLSKQLDPDPVSDDPFLGGFSKLVERVDANGDGVAESIRVNSNEHFTIGGTENNDIIIAGGGDDAIWGKGGNDRIEAGYGVDKVLGGDGDDIITNSGTDIGVSDFLHGNAGNDVIHGGSGLAFLFGNEGNDFLVAGPDGKQIFGGTGDDFILGGTGMDFLMGNEGDDWLEGGQRFDTLAGENSELFFNSSIIGHDVLNGGSGDTDYDAESGDDIMFQSEGIQRSNGMAGFDWAIHKGDSQAANSDLGIPLFATQEAFILRDRFDLVEGLSGWEKNDVLTGRREAVNTRAEATGTAAVPGPDSALDTYSNALLEKNVDLISGLRALVAHITRTTQVGNNEVAEEVVMDTADASDILLGGGGSDTIKGLAGNDVIDGDKWLNVRISVRANRDGTGAELFSVDSMTELAPRMLFGEINPGQLVIVREIKDGNAAVDVDTAVYTDLSTNYTFGVNSDGSLFVDHTGFVQPQQDDDLEEDETTPNPLSDGRDTIRGIEKLAFTDIVLNVIEGTNSGETLNGTADADLIVGKAGDDTLNGLAGNDILVGGAGNDTLIGGAGGDHLDGGEGTDTADYSASTAGVNVNLQADTYSGGDATGDTLNSIENVIGSSFNDTLVGDTAANILSGLDGNDTLIGGAGGDHLDGGDGTDTDTAVFSDLRANYTITSNPNGTITVAHVTVSDGLQSDGTDTLSNIERLRFSDIEIGINTPPTGAPVISDLTPTEGFALTLNNASIADAQGLGAFSYQWQSSANGTTWTNIAGATGATFTPQDLAGTAFGAQAGLQLRAVVTFTDGGGTVETVTSGPTGPVGANWDATPVVGGTFNGTAGNDIADGSNPFFIGGVDTLNGNAGDDTLNGNGGTDTISGGAGNDAINGGAGTDTAVFGGPAGNYTLNTSGADITVTDNVGMEGTDTLNTIETLRFNGVNYGVVMGTAGANANLNGVNGAANSQAVFGLAGNDTMNGGGGDDILLGGAGNDTITQTGGTDGRDIVDGGDDIDTYQLNGVTGAETFIIYSRAAATAAIAGLTLAASTEIVIARNGVVIAELDNIEEIIVNTLNTTANNGNNPTTPDGGVSGGDTIQVIGNFNAPFTSLNFNTITIDGNAGDDTVDISALSSAHRIVFRSNGGNDTIVGTLRPQDVIELPEGTVAADYDETTDENGVTTLSDGTHTISFVANGAPQLIEHGGDYEDDDDAGPDDDEDDDAPAPHVPGTPYAGTAAGDVFVATSGDDLILGVGGEDYLIARAGADVVRAGAGDDYVSGGAGADMIFGEDGDDDLFGEDGDDMLYGDDGDDLILGGAGNDLITAGAGNDSVIGGAGNDLFVAGIGDGSDSYYGDDMTGGLGTDTLDMAAITASITVNLGANNGHGSASSAQSGTDTLYTIENIVTGSGNDTITASNAVNVMDGGAGNDTFVFTSATAADGDTILGFQAGDRVDLSGIDAKDATGADDAFTLVSGGAGGAAGSLALTYETRDAGEFTVLAGHVNGTGDPEFRLSIAGHLTSADITL